MLNRRTYLVLAVAASGAILLSSASQAARPDGFPQRPIKIVVPWAPGGAADFLARVVGQRLAERTGQTVLVENRAGAATNIGTQAVALAPADGYTLLMASSNNCVNEALYSNLRFNFRKDFVPITNVAAAPNILVVNPKLPVKNVQELIALARRRPNELNYASSGNGSASHLAAERFKLQTKLDIVGIPYKGAGPAVADLLAGQVGMMFTVIPATLGHVKAGKLRVLAVATPERIALLPDVPTVAESGVPDFESSIWYGLVAPAKTPADIVQYLNTEVKAILSEPAMAEKLVSQGTFPIGGTPQAFSATIAADIDRYADLVRAASIRAE